MLVLDKSKNNTLSLIQIFHRLHLLNAFSQRGRIEFLHLFYTALPLSSRLSGGFSPNLNFPNAFNLSNIKNWAQHACNPHFTLRLECIKEAALKAKEMSQRVGGKVQQCRLCNVGSTEWQNDWAITYLLKAHFIGLCPTEIKWSEPRKSVCALVCFVCMKSVVLPSLRDLFCSAFTSKLLLSTDVFSSLREQRKLPHFDNVR